jgi:hypothetical protein
MLIYDDIYLWQGWGGTMRLGSGKCRLRIYDLKKGNSDGLSFLKPVIVVITDVEGSKMSIRSCTSHIATRVVSDFNLDPSRMMWLEYYPSSRYGETGERIIPARLDSVEFEWRELMAIKPKWRSVRPPLLDMVYEMMGESGAQSQPVI